MISNSVDVFSSRPVVILDLPLAANTLIIQPELVMIRVSNDTHDVGALCYALRSDKTRVPNGARQVGLDSLRLDRVEQIRRVVTVASMFVESGGKRPRSVTSLLHTFRLFVDWADANGCPDCLSGGAATREAFHLYIRNVEERYRRHDFESLRGRSLQVETLTMLEALTEISDLGKGVRLIRTSNRNARGTEPSEEHSFAHTLALNESLFQGLCDLVLGNKKFPFKLAMPKSLGWGQDYLWIFPTYRWCLPPHQHGETRAQLPQAGWAYDYEHGRVATANEIWYRYTGVDFAKRSNAKVAVSNAVAQLKEANTDFYHHFRLMLGAIAHNAFYFLFLVNTGGNPSPVIDLETDGSVDESTANPGYRTTKWRALGKEINLIVPIAFVPTLRRFMDLRRYLLSGQNSPFLFFSLGDKASKLPAKVGRSTLENHYLMLRRIDPKLPRMGPKKIRATVSDYYRRKHDAEIEAAVLQHLKATADRSYNAGTETRHHVELTLLLEAIAQKAQQKVVKQGDEAKDARPLEDGGVCTSYGQPESMSRDAPVKPNCRSGCLFCTKRVLIAGEEDTRKVASAAFLMEQLIMGPMSEAEFRPQIDKCDEDLAKIRAFEGCADMVDRVKSDVFENGNLTEYFSDKYQLFLTLGVL